MRPGCLALVVILILLVNGCAFSRNWEAALLLSDISAGTAPSRLKKTTPEPARRTVEYAIAGRAYRGDLYLSAEPVQAGLLLVPGAAEAGKDDPRLITLARSLARVGFAVLVPDLESLRELRVNPGNIREIADSFRYLAGREEFAPQGRAGLVAFSYAAGPAVLAALEPEPPAVEFILTVGGYYSMSSLLTFITTGDFRVDGTWRHLDPSPYGKWVLVQSNLHHLDDPDDREIFRAMIERKKADLSAPLEELSRGLGPQGQSLYRFVANEDRSRVPDLYGRLPQSIREEVERLDIADKNLANLESRLILVHGYDDHIIPYSESLDLARAMPSGQVGLYLVDGLMHVDARPGLIGRWRLWRALAALLSEREEEPP
jgi:pimeloyl-ACP methyl ester carboxylesterase